VEHVEARGKEAAEAYDLASDPGEQRDVASQHPDRVRRMLASLQEWFEDVERDRESINR